jgi:hypothetical protein
MPQRRRKPAPRPKQPARVRKAKTKKRRRRRGENTQRHPELWGLALVAAGVFLAAVLWLGWDGGVVGRGIERGLDRLVGAARLAFPPVLLLVGGLLVVRSALVAVRPFRTGLAVERSRHKGPYCLSGLLHSRPSAHNLKAAYRFHGHPLGSVESTG